MTHYPAHSRIYHIKVDSLDTPKIETGTLKNSVPTNKETNNAQLHSPLNDNSNSLSGLLAHYDSDSEHEDVNGQSSKLDAKVDDFLQEINKLTPSEAQESRITMESSQNQATSAWQECFDDSTGYPYYWNVATNVVTWEMPQEYKDCLAQNKTSDTQTTDKTISVTPVTTNSQPKQSIVSETVKKPPAETKKEPVPPRTSNKKRSAKVSKTKKPTSDSDDEKIVMITSFSEDSSSESETEDTKTVAREDAPSVLNEPAPVMGPHVEDIPKEAKETSVAAPITLDVNKKEIIEDVKEENIDETVILSRLRTQAKVLQELGGELPKSVDKSIIASDKLEMSSDSAKLQSLSLVAGYGDDSEPEEEPPMKSLFPIPIVPEVKEVTNESSQSTLFPATKPIDVKQFELPVTTKQLSQPAPKESTQASTIVDNKVFKRKKRLGVAFDVPQPKSEKRLKGNNDYDLNSDERKGFGFQSEETNSSDDKTERISFKKGGIAFIKSDTLNPIEPGVKINVEDDENMGNFQDMKDIVTEKVNFLQEGKNAVSPVQIMLIQLNTLEAAFKSGGLTQRYLYSWLRQTFTDLEKLEQDAAPEGWQCHWDRSNRRYFYRNQQSGETQWEYPEPDIVGGGEAMDICTTPPPNEEADESPEPPPPSQSPTPPPPPLISAYAADKRANKKPADEVQPPMPPHPPPDEVAPPPPPTISVQECQPLPPGVDSPDLPFFANKTKESSTEGDASTKRYSLGSELDSFYSDIALLEATTIPVAGSEPTKTDIENVGSPSSVTESVTSNEVIVKKKKKTKSKLGQGINMKKKAVSSLVEKWKKVQNDYL